MIITLKKMREYCESLHTRISHSNFDFRGCEIIVGNQDYSHKNIKHFRSKTVVLKVEDVKSLKDIDKFYNDNIDEDDKYMYDIFKNEKIIRCNLIKPFQFSSIDKYHIIFESLIIFE